MSKLRKLCKSLGIKRGDILITALLLTFSLMLGGMMLMLSPEPAFAVITVDGNEICRLPLNQNCTYCIGDTNIIEISDGYVKMTDANCPDKVCIHTGKISQPGQTIVCLPNRVVVSISGTDASIDVYAD